MEISLLQAGKFPIAESRENSDISQMVGPKLPRGMDRYRTRLVQLSKSPGPSLETLSEKIGKKRGYLRDYVSKGSPRKLDGDDRMRLASILKVPEADLGELSPPMQPAVSEPVTFPGATRDLDQYLRPVGTLRAGARDVPIYGYAKGGKDAYFVDQGAKLGMAYRPNALDSVPDAFAIEIWDHSMHPALKHGHQALVHPSKRPQPGEEVLVTLTDGQALVKELVRDTERTLILKQHNPPEEIKIDRRRVSKVQLIVDSPRVRL